MQTLLINIKQLVGITENNKPLRGEELKKLRVINDAFLLIKDDQIENFGHMYELELHVPEMPANVFDASGRIVMPTWCDSHTHIVFAGTRENEFVDKIKGLSYAAIAAKGGGILNSAKRLGEASEEELYILAMERLRKLIVLGTGAIEIKSGYGLTPDAELKMLRVIKEMKRHSPIQIKATFLGAHTYPTKFKENHEGYLKQIEEEMLPVIAQENLADYIDVFCEDGFFSAEETLRIVNAGKQCGLKPKLHVNQLNSIGGIEAGMALDALSLDHLETLTEAEIQLLGSYSGYSTLLPTAAFFLRMQYQPARALIDAGAAVTLASDFNPGSSPSGNMNFVAALSCIQLKMLPEEVIHAGTINGAGAMELEDLVGSIAIGKSANIIVTKPIPSYTFMFYSFGENHIEHVMINGQWVNN